MLSLFCASLLKTRLVYVTEAHSLIRLPLSMHVPALVPRDRQVPSLEAVENRPCSVSRFFSSYDQAIEWPDGWEESPLICIGKIRRRHINAK